MHRYTRKMDRKRTYSSTSDSNERTRTLSSASESDGVGRTRTYSSTSDSAESTDASDSAPPVKAMKYERNDMSELPYSSTAQKMMQKMGYKAGKGLGKYETGRVDIIEASKQRGLRGLGMSLKGLDADPNAKWDESEEVMIRQEPDWIPQSEQPIPTLDELNSWCSMAERKENIDDEFDFSEEDILVGVLENKSLFDGLTQSEMYKARSRANPYETIRGSIFQNRAAMKMAEIDASFEYMFTSHENYDSQSPDLLYFADICAGPGGFSEYVLWREKWHAKGFGFTLRASWANDFKIDAFIAGTPETFDCYYGEGGYKGDGDIFKDANLVAFRKYVKENTDNKGVHFVMADGGFSVEGKENIQEILSKQLYLCQFTCALSILREGGHFVCKVFDLFTPFSVGLVYLMYRAFEKICVFKPVTSRPANSERYIVCKSLRKDAGPIHDYMFDLNTKINNLKGSDIDIREVVPVSFLKEEVEFFDYIFSSNNSIGARQILGLRKLVTYVKNTALVGPSQAEVRKQCLAAWKIPASARANIVRNDPDTQFDKLIQHKSKWMTKKLGTLSKSCLEQIKSAYDYKCVLSGGDRVYLFSLGRQAVFQWNPVTHVDPTWKRVDMGNLELPRFTLLDAECMYEFIGEGRGQHKILGVHIMDVIYLGGKYVGDKPLTERIKYGEVFAKALAKPCRNNITRVHMKEFFGLNEMKDTLDKLDMKQMKKGLERKLTHTLSDGKYFIPIGVYLIKRLKDPWHLQFSRSSKQLYFYNSSSRKSSYEAPKSADFNADIKYCIETKLYWDWGKDAGVVPLSNGQGSISKEDLLTFVSSKL